MTPAVRTAHDFLLQHVAAGGCALDATAGRGHDTLFLARLLGPEGQVHACDVQAEALDTTRRRWEDESGPKANLHLHHIGHESVRPALLAAGVPRLCAVVFNLGYLPGGDRSLTTRPESTLAALRSLLPMLGERGVLTVAAYPGHPGGMEEFEAVVEWARGLSADAGEAALWQPLNQGAPSGPRLITVRAAGLLSSRIGRPGR